MKSNTHMGKAYTAAVLNALIIGLSFMFVKLALEFASPLDTLAHRFTISFAAAILLIVCRVITVNIRLRDILAILPLGLLYPALFFGFQSFGLLHASSSEGGILMAAVPIFTLFLASVFLKERTNAWQKLSVSVSVAGVIFIFVMQGASIDLTHLSGLLLLLLSTLCMAGYSVMARPLAKKYKPMDITFIMLAIGFVSFNAAALGKHAISGTWSQFIEPLANPTFLLSIAYLGILSSLVTALTTNYALSKMEASKMSVFGNLGTLVTIIAGVIFLGEPLFYYHIIGAIMILAGVLGTNLLGSKTQLPTSKKTASM